MELGTSELRISKTPLKGDTYEYNLSLPCRIV